MPKLTFQSTYPVSPDELFAWHERPGAIQRLTPPWVRTEVVHWEGIQTGQRAVLRLRQGPISIDWHALHKEYARGQQFVDVQESGPFQYWRHVHRFVPEGGGASLIDEIEFDMKGGALGDRLGAGFVRSEIERAFAYRHRVLGQDLMLHRHYNLSRVSLKIGITGSTGLIGSQLSAFFSAGGHKVTRIVRTKSGNPDEAYWNPDTGEIEKDRLEGLDVLIHLSGENVLSWRWNEDKKRRIRDSRVRSTDLLAKTIVGLRQPPSAFLLASGISAYGSQYGQSVSEASALKPGGFLSSVAKEWEAAAEPAVKAGIRFVFLRFGAVLTPRGGILKQVLPLFQCGLGGRFTGDQWVSWITMDDVIGSVYHVMMSTTTGPVNLVTPNPVTAQGFADTMGTVLHRPTFMVLPRGLARTVFGEVADEVLLESTKAHPAYLVTSDYSFLYSRLNEALRHVLGKNLSRRPPPLRAR